MLYSWQRLTENLNLFGLVKDMRRQRVAMVQTREQYILLHRAVRELFRERLKVIDAHPYENIATDGTPLILREKESDYEELYVKPEKQGEKQMNNKGHTFISFYFLLPVTTKRFDWIHCCITNVLTRFSVHQINIYDFTLRMKEKKRKGWTVKL